MLPAAFRACLLGGVLVLPGRPAHAASYIVPPIMPVPNAWQGRAVAVVRVLDKLDAHIETLTLKAGETGSYKSLSVTVRSCMDRPDGLPRDNGAFLEIQDRRSEVQPFSGWTFSSQPSLGVFESPVYGVQLVTCQGDLVAPLAPPLPEPVPPPESMMPTPPAVSSSDVDGSTSDTSSPAPADENAPDAGMAPGGPAAPAPADGGTAPAGPSAPSPQNGSDAAQPDPVYPAGPPPPPAPPADAPH
jgi:hypothetical protein